MFEENRYEKIKKKKTNNLNNFPYLQTILKMVIFANKETYFPPITTTKLHHGILNGQPLLNSQP